MGKKQEPNKALIKYFLSYSQKDKMNSSFVQVWYPALATPLAARDLDSPSFCFQPDLK